MAKHELLWNLVGVEKVNNPSKPKGTSLFIEEPEVADDCGIVRYIGTGIKDSPFSIGDKIYFGKHRQELRIAGKDILVMDASNVLMKETEDAVSENQVS